METFEFQLVFIEMCSLGSNEQNAIIGSDNGMVPNKPQAIIWTNACLVHWRIYASPGLDVLMANYQAGKAVHEGQANRNN